MKDHQNSDTHSASIAGLFDHPLALPAFLDEIPLGLAVLNENRQVVLVNRTLEGLTGYSRQEARGIPCTYILRSNVCLESCPALAMQDVADAVCTEANIINRDRQKIPVRITFSVIRNDAGSTVGYLEAVEDIRLLRSLNGKDDHAYAFGRIIGRSPQMEQIFRILPVIAQSDSSVLITGETGTGKDFLAEAIHHGSQRGKNPFIKVNCGALPETLLESELFGHQKGAFTGAFENKPGRFRMAHNGTLYLTEIGDLPLPLQVKLLTFLDDKIVFPLGGTKGFQVNVRVVAATHRNLGLMVREGRFREDLLFRLNVVRLHLPPVRERGDDIRLLLDHFLRSYLSRLKKPVKKFSANALLLLLEYSYPGNVRELRNIVEYAVNICEEEQILMRHLPAYLTDPEAADWGNEAKSEPPAVMLPPPSIGVFEKDWASAERSMIMAALMKSRGRRSNAAEILGWARSTLWRKMKYYGLAENEKCSRKY
jgi:two-component system response regulator AtoC